MDEKAKKQRKERACLARELPLKSPYLVQIFPVYACNFRCEYCIYALEKEKRGFISECTYMDFNLYKKVVDDLTRFKKKLKMLRFAAMGEPLIHPKIADMVRYAAEEDVAESIDIVTNGTLLTHELSIALADVGLSRLRVSLEGLSREDYRRHCGTDIDFESLVSKIRFFYKNKGKTTVYIKIIDYMLKSKEEEQLFYDIFGPISDQIGIEHLTPTINQIDYSRITDGKLDKPQDGERMVESVICPQPFYFLQINPDGNVVPCCNTQYPEILGNVRSGHVADIWNSSAYNGFRYRMLKGADQVCESCEECSLYRFGMHEEDMLDHVAEELKKYYKTSKGCV